MYLPLLIAAQLADFVTFAAVSLHTSGEANPFAAFLFDTHGILSVAFVKALAICVLALYVGAGSRFARGVALLAIAAGVVGTLVNVLSLGLVA
jgi:hypothetical protein